MNRQPPTVPALALLLATALTVAPTLVRAQASTLPDSTRRAVDEVFDFVGRGEPGCALGVIQDGIMVYGQGYGLANLDWRVPLSTSSVFDVGSVSKQFTAAAVVLLELDGVLSLDDDVRRWIPEIRDYGRTVTLRHLLQHTSGVRDYLTLERLAGTDFANVYDESDGVAMITRQRALNFEPGERYLYSNSGYLLLAHVVRRATGASLRSFLERRVFVPLGMTHTSVWDDNTEILAERATGYEPVDGNGWRIDHAWNFQMGGDGQVITSVEDLARWDANFYDPVVGGPALLERLHTRGVLDGGDTIPYALGLRVDEYRGLHRVQHGGSWAGFRAALVRFPEERTTIINLCNRTDADALGRASEVADIVLAGRFPEEPAPTRSAAEPSGPDAVDGVSLTDTELQRWTGLYRHLDRPEYVSLDVEDGELAVRIATGRVVPLVPLSPSEFTSVPPRLVVTFAEEDGGDRVRTRDRVQMRTATYREVTPGSAPLEPYAGVYHSGDLGVDFEVLVEDGRLRLRRVGTDDGMLLDRGREDEFFGRGQSVAFEREGGRVVGFSLDAGRVVGLAFEREERQR